MKILSLARSKAFWSCGLLLAITAWAQSTNDFKNTPLRTVEARADEGNPHAQFELALRYMMGKGQGNETNFVQAAIWLQRAADQGMAIAQHNLGGLYYSGFGTPRDYREAFKWYQKAAEQGFAPSQSFLGWAYANGKGVKGSFDEAIKWYKRAAEHGDKEAQFSLGLLYLKGSDLNPDYIEAYKWINLAAAQGHTNAVRIRQKIGRSMTQEQIEEGQSRANDFALGRESQTGATDDRQDNEIKR